MNDQTNPDIPEEEESAEAAMPDSVPQPALELSEVKRVLEAARVAEERGINVDEAIMAASHG